jgi:hypothetical protein
MDLTNTRSPGKAPVFGHIIRMWTQKLLFVFSSWMITGISMKSSAGSWWEYRIFAW